MATGTFDIGDGPLAAGVLNNRANAALAPECLRYRLNVLAGSAVDIVQSAGGWLYDRAMAGWQVAALLPQRCDARALRILGVRVMALESELEGEGAATQSLAVSAEVFIKPHIRQKVLTAMDNHSTEIALWGEGWPLGVDRRMNSVQYVLSTAARTFKGHALTAAGISRDPVEPTETLLTGSARLG